MPSYYTLAIGSGYLNHFPPVVEEDDEQGGIKQSDVDRAEEDAFNEINSELAWVYDVSAWSASPPPIIATLGHLLGAAYLWAMRRVGDGVGVDGEPEGVRRQALAIIEELKRGSKQVILSDGTVQPRNITLTTADLQSA